MCSKRKPTELYFHRSQVIYTELNSISIGELRLTRNQIRRSSVFGGELKQFFVLTFLYSLIDYKRFLLNIHHKFPLISLNLFSKKNLQKILIFLFKYENIFTQERNAEKPNTQIQVNLKTEQIFHIFE